MSHVVIWIFYQIGPSIVTHIPRPGPGSPFKIQRDADVDVTQPSIGTECFKTNLCIIVMIHKGAADNSSFDDQLN